MDLALNKPQRFICHKTQPNRRRNQQRVDEGHSEKWGREKPPKEYTPTKAKNPPPPSVTQRAPSAETCRDLLTNINKSDYSFAQEKLHPGTAKNDEALFDPNLPLQLRKENK